MTDKKKKKLSSIAKKGAKGFNRNKMPLSVDNNYVERGDLDESQIVDVANLSYRGTGYTQGNTTANSWANLLQRTGTAGSGSYFRHQKKIYLSAGSTSTEVKF